MPAVPGKKKTKTKLKRPKARKVLHSVLTTHCWDGESAIGIEKAKSIMGWTVEGKGEDFKSDFLLKDLEGNKVRCLNNIINRPLYMSTVLTLMQEILRGKWKLNGESRILGVTGLVLNGQHTFIALILASQDVQLNPDKWEHWQDEEPFIETTLVTGVEETDEVINTMDTCKPRSLADVIYRSSFFAEVGSVNRKKVSKICDAAVKMMWSRTGAKQNAFAPIRTHAESLDFLARHPKLLECVNHIFEENGKENRVGGYLTLGYCSALMYLMGSSTSSSRKYQKETDERSLDWKNFNVACEFWSMIAASDKRTEALRLALVVVLDESGSPSERIALIVKAWIAFVNKKSITSATLKLKYKEVDGWNILAETPVVGGVDVGDAD